MGEEKSFSQRAFSIYTDIRKLQDKAKTSYTLSTRRLRFGYEQQFMLAGGGTLNCPILTSGGYGAEIQYQGVKVLSNLGNGWGYEMTPAELAKKDEFYSIYWSEYNLVKESGSPELYDKIHNRNNYADI